MNRWITFLLTAFFPTVVTSVEYPGPIYAKAQVSLENFSEKLATENNLYLLNQCVGDVADSPKSAWSLSYTSNEQLTLEETRPKVATLVRSLLYKIYHDPLFREHYQKSGYRLPFGNNVVSFKIAFWDEDVDRPLPPCVAQARYANGEVYFHYADSKTQALLPPIVESLESLGVMPDEYLDPYPHINL